MKKINILLKEYPYDILVGYNILKNVSAEFSKRKISGSILIITDKNVYNLHSLKIKSAFRNNDRKVKYFIAEPGENTKSFEVLHQIFSLLINEKFGRDSLIIAIGGGVIGDLAGFAAATFMRGVQFVQVPTTLLASVDSSVGGKTGINFDGTKNIIGAFYQPRLVITDLQFLETLPEEELLCGFGEIIKYSFLSGYDLYETLQKKADRILSRDLKLIERLVIKSVNIKKAVVLQDEKETGMRKILNLGHTFAHAFESALDFRIKHGEAVIAGIVCALRLSSLKGFMPEEASESYINFIINFIRTKELKNINNKEIYNLMLKDKKNSDGKIRFVLVKEPGKLFIDIGAERKEVNSVITYFKNRI